MVVYASPPLSGGGVEPPNAKLATFRKMRLPVALELLELLATVNIPQADRLVGRPTDELPRIRRVEIDAKDRTAAIVSNVSFTGNCSTPLPRSGGEAKKKSGQTRNAWQNPKKSLAALQLRQALALF
jgi:hypothetical protein